jgi:hypothetical protein
MDEWSVSLLLERVDTVCRSGEDLVGLWSLSRLCGGDGEVKVGWEGIVAALAL